MATSEEDEEQEAFLSDSVTDYEFVYDKNELVSFAMLPVVWGTEKLESGSPWPIFVSGKVDNGLRKLYKEAVAWKFDLECNKRKPELSVLSADGTWFKLLKPRSRFQEIVRTIQIAVHFLHFCKWHPQGSEKALWDHLDKIFSVFEDSPSEDDLQSHLFFIKEAGKRDEALANSKVFTTFMEEKLRKRKVVDEDIRPSFIVDDADEITYEIKDTDMNEPYVSESEETEDEGMEDDIYDSVCAICDNGGHLLMCDGKCLRSFHPTKDDAIDADCETLGFNKDEEEALDTWLCKNCEYKRHQCYACGNLGSSDDSTPTGAQVFCCINGACGYFYHPLCVAKLLYPENDSEAKEHARKIALGERFACPAHRCHACKELEVRKDHELQFAVCRRCPRAYHRKCLPREIAFEKDVIEGTYAIQRAWEGLIPDRILIYCLEHEIDPEVGTPSRNHLKFPDLWKMESKRHRDMQERVTASQHGPRKRGLLERADLSERRVKKRVELGPDSKKHISKINNNFHEKDFSGADDGKLSLGSQLFSRFYTTDIQQSLSSRIKTVRAENKTTTTVDHMDKGSDYFDTLDTDAKRRILNLMNDAACSIALDKVKRLHKAPSTHSKYLHNVDSITLGKLECVRQALHAALRKLEDGGSIKDAKAICGDDIIVQIQRWREKLRVYLAPFLYGPRYTSFGRHFTKVDKLQEVVDILHWYVEEGDMIVDFCCGSNDFSCLLKSKLDNVGKKASFKNYDIVHPKNDFNFERRDWMRVGTEELPSGSQLIMGLNPPFGVNGALANKFINKALTFMPKLIILIVPRETERLDKKEFAYDLIWEDDHMFVGKSFYLPGCVDGNEKQIEDWNINTPTLSLWSHPDFTVKHRSIAERHSHSSGAVGNNRLSGNGDMDISSLEECHDSGEGVVNVGEDLNREPEKQEANPKLGSEHQDTLPEGSTRAVTLKDHPQPKKDSWKFHEDINRGRQLEDNVPSFEPSKPLSELHHPSHPVVDYWKFEKYSLGHPDSPNPQMYSRGDDSEKFDYLKFITDDTHTYDDSEAVEVVSRYHTNWNDEGAPPYCSAGASNNSMWNEHPDRRALARSYSDALRGKEHGSWTSGNTQQAYPTSTTPSYRGQVDPLYRELDPRTSYQPPFPSSLSALDQSRRISGGASAEYAPNPLEFRYAPGATSATHTSTSLYAPAPERRRSNCRRSGLSKYQRFRGVSKEYGYEGSAIPKEVRFHGVRMGMQQRGHASGGMSSTRRCPSRRRSWIWYQVSAIATVSRRQGRYMTSSLLHIKNSSLSTSISLSPEGF